ncbi:non-hydrolyzing UDP-N-acetylglucosamine 2-epimerase [Photobacterium lucens]|uniref:non-hydrolyzing UDP-N-acetylglucosamine 2-epimerase n=1 Tax=Photobacterium lucens TaxID=2562949 RepID=UPI00137201AB|nr:UDP-N-acetylglucosamine 2-epimerase (non-hydrolyzing) [Photobacterium lucens]MBP2701088.1 UDP-N-acetylglucosamine 2-epimerase (non-hydrolyzing) [Vibrio parahaemolyticus]MZG57354.1 UDP-N-acetylglucosamine 2-epimerase (non-hydrolyzing) [Photobacterium lucens]MZG81104.1 UDP-N-acetylglucosamine 2-epimerase (non-hydrolyzing) [Photobacterium lucens]
MPKKTLIITGTRPEIIKMAPVYNQFKQQGQAIEWCHTGQHDTLAEQTFEVFDIKPDYVFQRPAGSTLTDLLSGLMTNIQPLLLQNAYDCVLVHGDTSSTLAGAMTAFYAQVPCIGHVEAGLRSGNLQHPFPEESNRTLVARIANLHFAPTEMAKQALLSEGVNPESVMVTGNTAIDAQKLLLDKGILNPEINNTVLVTAHRRENWQSIPTICEAIKQLSALKPELHFIVAVHPNPTVKQAVIDNLNGVEQVTIVEPLDYLALQQVLASSVLTMTDSGGIQEEAPTYGTPVVILRETTERPEALNLGLSVLAGAEDSNRIVDAALTLLTRGKSTQCVNPYGKGDASEMICQRVKEY